MADTMTIKGNIAGEPKLVYGSGGVPIATFRVASERRRFDQATQKWVDEEPNWYQVSAFRGLAVHAAASFQKGQRVIVAGRLRVRRWNSGEKSGLSVEIEADALGHDLLFGTTAFQSSAASPPDDWSAPAGDVPSAVAPQSVHEEEADATVFEESPPF